MLNDLSEEVARLSELLNKEIEKRETAARQLSAEVARLQATEAERDTAR